MLVWIFLSTEPLVVISFVDCVVAQGKRGSPTKFHTGSGAQSDKEHDIWRHLGLRRLALLDFNYDNDGLGSTY